MALNLKNAKKGLNNTNSKKVIIFFFWTTNNFLAKKATAEFKIRD